MCIYTNTKVFLFNKVTYTFHITVKNKLKETSNIYPSHQNSFHVPYYKSKTSSKFCFFLLRSH